MSYRMINVGLYEIVVIRPSLSRSVLRIGAACPSVCSVRAHESTRRLAVNASVFVLKRFLARTRGVSIDPVVELS